MLNSPSRAPPGVTLGVFQKEAIQITGRNSLPNLISSLPLANLKPQLQVSPPLALWPHQGCSHFLQLWMTGACTCTLIFTYLNPPFLQFRARHFKNVFPLLQPHHSQSITKSCQFYLPSPVLPPESIWCVSFFHSHSTGIALRSFPSRSLPRLGHCDWTGLNWNSIPSQDGEASYNP